MEDLAELHTADRLMVQLIQIDRLAPRVEGMLYKAAFNESWGLLDDVGDTCAYFRIRLHSNFCRVPKNYWTQVAPSYMPNTSKSFSAYVIRPLYRIVIYRRF